MKLISCKNCGVVLNQDKLMFAVNIDTEDGSIDESKADYDQDRKDYFAFVPCPVCGEKVFKDSN